MLAVPTVHYVGAVLFCPFIGLLSAHEQIIEKMNMLGVDAEKIAEYPVDVLSTAFGFGDMEYFAGIRMFNRVIDKWGVNMTHQERYEVFDRIYEEGMRAKKDKYKRNSR